MSKKAFVGFGFGPIQSGLMLFEAWRSGNFSSFTVAEIDASMVQQVRDNGGAYTLNIAKEDGIEQCTVPGVRMLNPRLPADRAALVDAVAQADELATALPSVKFFDGDAASVVAVLSEALNRAPDKQRILYTAENDNHAAEILLTGIQKRVAPANLANFQVLNTVVGKMSGVISDAPQIQQLQLATMTPTSTKAILVEQFNRILISRITLPGFTRGITVFGEKPDLMPFEEAKLYGHNAIHALIGYLAHQRGLQTMAQVTMHPDILAIARKAFIDESGAALVNKYAHLGDPLFTHDGYVAYADDLLRRMVNPNLTDLVERVIRDPQRKCSWNDRVYGTMRLALQQGISPVNMARGAAAAVTFLLGARPANRPALALALRNLWGASADANADRLIDLTWNALA